MHAVEYDTAFWKPLHEATEDAINFAEKGMCPCCKQQPLLWNYMLKIHICQLCGFKREEALKGTANESK